MSERRHPQDEGTQAHTRTPAHGRTDTDTPTHASASPPRSAGLSSRLVGCGEGRATVRDVPRFGDATVRRGTCNGSERDVQRDREGTCSGEEGREVIERRRASAFLHCRIYYTTGGVFDNSLLPSFLPLFLSFSRLYFFPFSVRSFMPHCCVCVCVYVCVCVCVSC